MQAAHLANWRAELAYSPHVIGQLSGLIGQLCSVMPRPRNEVINKVIHHMVDQQQLGSESFRWLDAFVYEPADDCDKVSQ
jgi:hypothetical protein